MRRAQILEWTRRVATTAEVVFSICTGSLILAAAGVLRGRPATTHRDALTLLSELDPTCTVVTDRIVDNGSVVCAAGVSAGLDASLYLVARLSGADVARECAEYIEYAWEPAVEVGR
jgi:transcriptional regulator GlxA family with amidase domain